jgi:hypothetical protein
MKKRIALFLAFAAFIGGEAFTQNRFVSAEASILGGGARYEYMISPYFTLSANVYYNYIPTPFMVEDFTVGHSIVGTGMAGRWYPAGQWFFVELGLAYISFTNYYRDIDDSGGELENSYPGFSIAPGFGWTLDVGGAGGFFISPGIKIPFIMSSESFDIGLGEGVVPSVIVFFGLGYAF